MANDVEVKVEQQTERPRRETHGNKNVLVRFCEKSKRHSGGNALFHNRGKAIALHIYRLCAFLSALSAAVMVFCISMVMVMGPTPPGTGVM